jgi:hypothetical protein
MFMKPFFIVLLAFLPVSVMGRDGDTLSAYSAAIHFTSPIGLISKAGIKVEVRNGDASALLSATVYYGVFRGGQFSLEGRRYLNGDKGTRGQSYGYAKGIGGYQQHLGHGSGFGYAPESPYFGGGIGLGRHIAFRHFFFDFNTGLKYVHFLEPGISDIFYVTGPGALLDIHVNWGFQF